MSTGLEAELRAAFEAASESVMPRADLAGRIRRAARRRRRNTGVLIAVILVVTGYLTSSFLTGRLLQHPAPGHHALVRGAVVRLSPRRSVEALAAAGAYLYLATDNGGGPPYTLGAYSRATGRLIRQVSLPAEPVAVRAGPGSSVWLTIYPNQNGGPCETWLLTADLSERSATSRTCSPALLPTGPAVALTVVENGQLATLTMPPPGRLGRASWTPYANVGHYAVVSLAQVGSNVAALVANDFGDFHVVMAGQSDTGFGGGSGPQVESVAAAAGSLWVTTARNNGPDIGPLVQLSATLRPVTPIAIEENPILRRSEQVWSHGDTIWVATASAAHHLVCFTDRAHLGTYATIPVRGQPTALATVGRTVYITIANSAGAADVFAYPIPPECA